MGHPIVIKKLIRLNLKILVGQKLRTDTDLSSSSISLVTTEPIQFS